MSYSDYIRDRCITEAKQLDCGKLLKSHVLTVIAAKFFKDYEVADAARKIIINMNKETKKIFS